MRLAMFPAAAALCGVLTAGAAATADPYDGSRPDENTIVVKATSAEMQTVKGARKVALRLRIAAATVCGGDDPISRLSEDFPKCREDAIDRAISGLNAPLVAEALGRSSVVLARAGHR